MPASYSAPLEFDFNYLIVQKSIFHLKRIMRNDVVFPRNAAKTTCRTIAIVLLFLTMEHL